MLNTRKFFSNMEIKGHMNRILHIILKEMLVKKNSFERSEKTVLKAIQYIDSNISQTQSKITVKDLLEVTFSQYINTSIILYF